MKLVVIGFVVLELLGTVLSLEIDIADTTYYPY